MVWSEYVFQEKIKLLVLLLSKYSTLSVVLRSVGTLSGRVTCDFLFCLIVMQGSS